MRAAPRRVWILGLAMLASFGAVAVNSVPRLRLNLGMIELGRCLSSTDPGKAPDWNLLDDSEPGAPRCAGAQAPFRDVEVNQCAAKRSLAVTYLSESDPGQAAAELEPVLSTCLRDPFVPLYLGTAYWRMGRTADAVLVWQSLPHARELFLQRGLAYRRMKDLGQASVYFSASGMIDPSFAAAHYWLGITANGMGKLDEAEAAMQEAVDADPDYVKAYWPLGRYAEVQGDAATARRAYRRLLEFSNIEPFMKMLVAGRLKYMDRDWPGALSAFEKVRTLQSTPEEYRHLAEQYIAETHVKLGQ